MDFNKKYDKVIEAADKINKRLISEGYLSLSDLLVPLEEEKIKLYFMLMNAYGYEQ